RSPALTFPARHRPHRPVRGNSAFTPGLTRRKRSRQPRGNQRGDKRPSAPDPSQIPTHRVTLSRVTMRLGSDHCIAVKETYPTVPNVGCDTGVGATRRASQKDVSRFSDTKTKDAPATLSHHSR